MAFLYQFFLCVVVVSVRSDELGSLIDEVFGSVNKPNEVSPSSDAKNPLDCTCVPYYLCQNNSIITDGVGLIDIRASDGPCQNYLDVCCQAPLSKDQAITPTPLIKTGCGKRNPEGVGFRITGDQDHEAQFGEFPWMIAVLKEEDVDGQTLNIFQCGGSLIHPQVVLTAAHCVNGRESRYKVRAGEWDTQTNNELFPHQDMFVQTVVIHPEFSSGTLINDIALLFLESPLVLAENIDLVCLPTQNENFDFSNCFASGWGKDLFGKEGKYQVILKKIELPIVPNKQCQDSLRRTRLGPYFNLHSTFICAGGEAGKDTCKGDGGSPLVCPLPNKKNTYAQVGIVAWGVGCGDDNTPGVYVNVPRFSNWIQHQFAQNNVNTKPYN